ncbi:CHAT domain-containing protein [Aspergillus undulatus]|uniref:CHAT domain-containing protein n=1 Tax=Aspergillus undulatus TaxID=1810928 RepID=UPI003CCC9C7C
MTAKYHISQGLQLWNTFRRSYIQGDIESSIDHFEQAFRAMKPIEDGYLNQCCHLAICRVYKWAFDIHYQTTKEGNTMEPKDYIKQVMNEISESYGVNKKDFLSKIEVILYPILTPDSYTRDQPTIVALLICVHEEWKEMTGKYGDGERAFSYYNHHYNLTANEDMVSELVQVAYADSLSQCLPKLSQLPRCQSILGDTLRLRFERRGKIDDLDLAIGLTQKAAAAYPSMADYILNVCGTLFRRYEVYGAKDDLDKTIEGYKRVRQLACDDQALREKAEINQAHCLVARFEQTGASGAITIGIQVATDAVYSSQDSIIRAQRLNIYSILWARHYETTTDLADLNMAIELSHLALSVAPSHPRIHSHFSNLGTWLGWRYDRHRTGNGSDLDAAIENAELGIKAVEKGSLDHASYLGNLCKLRKWKYEESQSAEILNRTIQDGEEAWQSSPANSLAQIRGVHNLCEALMLRYQKINEDATSCHRAIYLWESALSNKLFPPIYRVNVAVDAMELLKSNMQYNAALKIAKSAISILAKVSPRSLPMLDQQRIIQRYEGLACDAAALTLHCGGTTLDAIQLLEQGRGILADHQFHCRSDLSQLDGSYPEKAARFRKLTHDLDTPPGPGSEELSDRSRQSDALDELIDEVRQLPGFVHFLCAPSEARLFELAQQTGQTIVIVNVSSLRCDTFIIGTKERISVCSLGQISKDITLKGDRWNNANDYGKYSTLQWLWDNITRPVVEDLQLNPVSEEAKETAWPRICWIPTGSLCRLPLHASGNHESVMKETVLDHAISSYSVTAKALMYTYEITTRKTISDSRSALLVAMPETLGLKKLINAGKEVEKIAKLLRGEHQAMVDSMITPSCHQVLAKLPKVDLFHFAGHGRLNLGDASKSALIMQDGPLTVANLLPLRLHTKAPFLAFLSACNTGVEGSGKLSDEGMHLVAAFQIAGFQNVIGTLWKVQDKICADIALAVYREVLNSSANVPWALHMAVRKARDFQLDDDDDDDDDGELALRNGVPDGEEPRITKEDPNLWAAYIHVGL